MMIALLTSRAAMADPAFYFGGDISALPDLEKLGAVYRNEDGKPGDAIAILRAHNCNLFRVRLFVKPGRDFDKNGGPTQDLPMVLALAKRIKTSGAKLSLAIHYSDTWADPANQFKPAQWKDLPFNALKQKVTDYTTGVLQAMQINHTPPDIVEVGNETTNGMLWPDGKLDGKTPEEKEHQWDNYAELEKAAIAGVRRQLPGARILIHINAGGKPGMPSWFFSKLKKFNPDFDIIGLSFYPTFGDSLDGLKKNLTDLPSFGKDILIIEAAYPYKPVKQTATPTWPMTPAGQKQFLDDLISTVKATPNHRGTGVIWWYPEAQPLANHRIWQGAALALFDASGNPLPSLNVK
jgi:arabinogalactan endo-1,4-beta-galactosidase